MSTVANEVCGSSDPRFEATQGLERKGIDEKELPQVISSTSNPGRNLIACDSLTIPTIRYLEALTGSDRPKLCPQRYLEHTGMHTGLSGIRPSFIEVA